jgi:hypothetical protein
MQAFYDKVVAEIINGRGFAAFHSIDYLCWSNLPIIKLVRLAAFRYGFPL